MYVCRFIYKTNGHKPISSHPNLRCSLLRWHCCSLATNQYAEVLLTWSYGRLFTTSLPQLSKPARTLKSVGQACCSDQHVQNTTKSNAYLHFRAKTYILAWSRMFQRLSSSRRVLVWIRSFEKASASIYSSSHQKHMGEPTIMYTLLVQSVVFNGLSIVVVCNELPPIRALCNSPLKQLGLFWLLGDVLGRFWDGLEDIVGELLGRMLGHVSGDLGMFWGRFQGGC